jgi:hypothetical protein
MPPHIAAVVVGFVMMVVGLALGVTMIMLPVGLVIGLLGVASSLAGCSRVSTRRPERRSRRGTVYRSQAGAKNIESARKIPR